MYKSENLFIKFVYEKQEFSWSNFFKYHKHRRELRKFRKTIYNGSPDYFTLWDMADFIKFAEDVFYYNNSLDNNTIGLFSSRNYKEKENGFKITNSAYSKDCDITVKLSKVFNTSDMEYDLKVSVEITNLINTSKTTLKFINNDWYGDTNTPENQMILDNAIDIINTCILELFDYCYSRRFLKRYDIDKL